METNEISELAKTHAEAILSAKMTRAEMIMLLACIQARVEQSILTGVAPVSAPVKASIPGVKLADKGYPCVCVMCAKHIYTLNRDLYDNTKVGEFIEAFTPMPGYQPLNRQTKISNIENNITTNCESCGAELSVYLAGKQI